MFHAKSFLPPMMRFVGALAIILLSISTIPALAGVQGSVHDFSNKGWSDGQICNVCHTPHSANTDVEAPLWNHSVSVASYTTYNSPTLYETAAQPTAGSTTRLCLSCHDGTIAIDSFGGNTGSAMVQNKAKLGTDLSNDHPISIKWKHQTSGSESGDCLNCHDFSSSDPYGKELRFFGVARSKTIECPTCHDVHNTNKAKDLKLLRQVRAKLCLQCHGK